jgi:hypothetical protein
MADRAIGNKWVKGGPSPNPGGRISHKAAITILREELDALGPKGDETNMRLIVRKMIYLARDCGSVKAADFLCDRAYGKPVQAIDLNANVQHVAREETVRLILERVGVLTTNDTDAKPRVN